MIRNYDKLIFELSKEGRVGYSLPKNELKEKYCMCELPASLKRESKPCLPQVTEFEVVRHYTNLSNKNFGVDTGFYPLGSCTMKYNPRINEKVASFDGFTRVHPLQDEKTVEGCTELMDMLPLLELQCGIFCQYSHESSCVCVLLLLLLQLLPYWLQIPQVLSILIVGQG